MITNMEELKKQEMESLFCPYEQALDLKELGFDEPCFGHWNYNSGEINYYYDKEIQNERTNKWLLNLEKQFPKMNKSGCTAPIYSQVFRWFRDKHKLIPNIHSIYEDETLTEIKFWFWFGNHEEDDSEEEVFYDTYEEAELECLKQLIKLIKK